MIGKIFGVHRVVKKLEETDNYSHKLYECECIKCKTKSKYTKNDIKSNKVGKTCIICRHEPYTKGKIYGELTIISEKPYIKNGVNWIDLECSCGYKFSTELGAFKKRKNMRCINRSLHRNKDIGNIKDIKKYNVNGYILLYLPDHPNASKGGTVAEHVFIMSEYLGRPLIKGETIHHKNGIRNDNRIKNLEIWFKGHPIGQRVEDLIEFAKELLYTYDPKALSVNTRKLLKESEEPLLNYKKIVNN